MVFLRACVLLTVLFPDLVVSSAVDAIQVRDSGVRIDLNGFSIRGSDLGTMGISTAGIYNIQGTLVRNGTIRDFTDDGISLSLDTRIERMRVLFNDGAGVTVNDGSMVVDSGVFGNGGNGVQLPLSVFDDARARSPTARRSSSMAMCAMAPSRARRRA